MWLCVTIKHFLKATSTGPIKCYGQFNIAHEPATLDKYSKQCGKVIDKEILYYKANTEAIGKSDAFVGSVKNQIIKENTYICSGVAGCRAL